jgi:hypothetical protein
MNNFNREDLISDYVDRIIDNMSTKDMMRILGDQIEENLSSYTDEELISEVNEHYPELLDGNGNDEPSDAEMIENNSCGTPWHDGCR